MYNSYFPFGLAFTHFHPGSDMDFFMEQTLDDVLAPEGDFEDDDDDLFKNKRASND